MPKLEAPPDKAALVARAAVDRALVDATPVDAMQELATRANATPGRIETSSTRASTHVA